MWNNMIVLYHRSKKTALNCFKVTEKYLYEIYHVKTDLFRKKYITLNLIIVLLCLRHVNFYYWSISGLYRFSLSQEIPYKQTNKPTYTRELKKTHSTIISWIFTIALFQACIVFSLVRKSRTNQPTCICVNKKHTPPSPRGFLLLICLCRR